MDYSVILEGFEGRQVTVRSAGFFNGTRLLVDGQPASPGPKKGEYLLRRNDGRDVVASLKAGFPDPAPALIVDGQTHRLAPPLAWYEWLWIGAPLVLIFLGGAIGGALGGAAMAVNAGVFRSEMPPVARYAATGAISFAAVAGFVVFRVGIAIATGR